KVGAMLKNDRGPVPLRLVITYMADVDHAGHKFGPDAKEVDQAVLNADATLDTFIRSTIDWFDAAHAKSDELYVIITTDHGMAPVQMQVNLDRLIGAELLAGAKVIFSGPLANVYLNDVPASERPERARKIIEKLN